MMAAVTRPRQFPSPRPSTNRTNTTATSSSNPRTHVCNVTPYMTPSHSTVTSQQGVLVAIRGLSKKQDDMYEKLLDLERKVLTFMQESFDITKTSYYVMTQCM